MDAILNQTLGVPQGLFPGLALTPATVTQPGVPPGLNGARVVLCEEDARVRRLLVHYLGYHGAQVLEADNGEAAFELCGQPRVDLVLVSMEAPRGGLALVQRLRADPTRTALPVVALSSGFVSSRSEMDFQEKNGLQGAFRKPTPLRDLLVCLEQLVKSGTRQVRVAGAVAAAQRTRTASQIRSVVMQGENSVAGLAAVASRIYQNQLSGVLEIKDGVQLRRITLAHGLVVGTNSSVEDERLSALLLSSGLITMAQAEEAQRIMKHSGCRFGYAVVRAANVPASAVAQAVEEQTLWVAMLALSSSQGTWSLVPMVNNPVLATQVRLDPMEVVMRGCLDVVPREEARGILQDLVGQGSLHATASFLDRAAMFSMLRPRSQLLTMLLGVRDPTVALAKASMITGGVNELLAMVASGAYFVGESPADAPAQPRASVFGALGGQWRTPGVTAQTLALREDIALEWLRGAGETPQDVLGVPPAATLDEARAAAAKLRERFGPALDTQDLGPARSFLHIIRARVREAGNVLGV